MKLHFPIVNVKQTFRILNKTKRTSLLLLFLPAMLIVLLGACRDEDFVSQMSLDSNSETKGGMLPVTSQGGLIQNNDGTWSTNNCRVPLVGPGRVVNQISTAFVSAIVGNTGIGNVINTDLDDEMSFAAGVAGVEAIYQPIVSVRDLYRTYASGQEVGFVYTGSSETGVLTADLLQGMSIELYKEGVKQESTLVNEEGKVVGLDLLTVGSNGNVKERVVSFTATKPFDEVRLCMTGVGITALKSGSMSIKYAFVGENPEIRATNEDISLFNDFWINGKPVVNKTYELLGSKMSSWTSGVLGLIGAGYTIEDLDNLVDGIIDNSAQADFGLLKGLEGDHYTTVNFKREIPAGYEVGYKYSSAKLLGVKLLTTDSPKLIAYNSSNTETGDESQISGNLAGVSVLGTENDVMVSMALNNPCSQLMIRMDNGLIKNLLDLESMYFHYAYVRQGVSLDPSAYFTFPDDTTFVSNYRLPSVPSQGKGLQYAMISQPYGADAHLVQEGGGWKLQGMTKAGVYRVQALYTAPDDKQLSQIANIYRVIRNSQNGCNTYITVDSHGAYATEPIGWSGCLLCLFNSSNNANAVVDMNPENFAVRRGLLSLIGVDPMIAIQMNTPVLPKGKKIRTGFIVQANNGLLNVSLLNNYTIRLYRSGAKVDEASGTGGLLGLGLIDDESGRVRISMETDKEFDRIELWCQEVLDLSLNDNLRIYNMFYEDVSCSEGAFAGTCMETMSDVSHGLKIDFDMMLEGVSVGVSLNGLGNLLDSDLETGVELNSVLELLSSGFQIPVSFDRMEQLQPIGVVIDKGNNVLDLDLLSYLKLEVFDGGYEETNKVASTSDLEIVDLGLLDHNGKVYLEVTPSRAYDRIKISVDGGLLSLGLVDIMKVTGIYTRPDTDGDGIPDCSETETETAVELYDGAHACEGDNLIVGAKTEATNGTFYMMECKNQTSGKTYEKEIELQQDNSGKFFSIPDLPKGEYLVSVYALGSGECLWNGAYATVHPLLTEWTGDVSTEWNKWDNWTEGAPWECTNVIIPSDVAQYPVVAAGDCCQNIHFEEGTAALNTHLLKYEKAFVDIRVKGGQYTYLSAPLQEMVTGDMYINSNVLWDKDDYFTVMNKNNYPENRVNPIVYQRIWGGTRDGAYELPAVGDGVPVEITQTGWSTDFNSVTMKYNAGEGFSLRAGKEGDYNSYRFRFPKAQSTEFATGTVSKETYSYYSEEGNFIREETFDRTPEFVGRFFNTDNGNVNVTLTAGHDGYLLVGNPYMAYISVTGFMTQNNITELKMYDGNTNRTVLMSGGDVLTSDSEQAGVIAPMQSVLVKTSATTINFTATMQVQPVQATPASRSKNNGLYISASKGEYTATCMLAKSEAADNAYRVSEDAEILMDGDSVPIVEVFTVVGSKALNIQQVRDAVRIPLGVCLRTPGDVRLMFSSDDVNWEDWKLEDTKTGQTYSMKELKQGITVAGMQSNSGRLVFVKD